MRLTEDGEISEKCISLLCGEAEDGCELDSGPKAHSNGRSQLRSGELGSIELPRGYQRLDEEPPSGGRRCVLGSEGELLEAGCHRRGYHIGAEVWGDSKRGHRTVTGLL